MAEPAAKPAARINKSTHGGRRAGAGRPRTRAIQAMLSHKLISELETLGDDLLPAVRELVRGVYVEQPATAHRPARVYQQPPNPQMIIYVIDRLLGRMPTRVEGVDGGAPIAVTSVTVRLETPEGVPLEAIEAAYREVEAEVAHLAGP